MPTDNKSDVLSNPSSVKAMPQVKTANVVLQNASNSKPTAVSGSNLMKNTPVEIKTSANNAQSNKNTSAVNISNNSKNQVNQEFYNDLNKLPTDPNLSLISQTTPFMPIAKKPSESILAPEKMSPAEANYLYQSGVPVVQSASKPLITISDVYSTLRKEAEESEAVALSGSQIEQFRLQSEGPDEENNYVNVTVGLIEIISLIVLVLPFTGLFTRYVSILFLPTLLFMIVSLLLTAAFRVNSWITGTTLIILLWQISIAIFVILKLLGYISGEVQFIGEYLNAFYL